MQLYKFGKIASMPKWEQSHQPTSFIDIILDNQKINAHTLLLIDIGLGLNEALKQLEEVCKDKIKLNKIIVCEKIGTQESKIYYKKLESLKSLNVKSPFCIIIPSELHFMEKEVLEKSR